MTHAILTCSPYFTDFALRELQRHHPQAALVEQISPQHLLVDFPEKFGALIQPWREQLPIYIHHLFPVHRTLTLTGTSEDFNRLRCESQSLCQDAYTTQSCVLGEYAYSAVALEQALCPGQTISNTLKSHGRILSVLVVDQRCFMGIAWKAPNLNGFINRPRFYDEPVPNRAGLKLLESLATFNVKLRSGDYALDLGAAPGAWTEILRRRGMHVTAVAPRPMYDWLATDPMVRPHCMTAEEYLPICDTVYDLIVNDMKLDPQDSARLMTDYAAHLRPGGIAIMTLKLRLRDPRRVMDHTFRILRKTYKIIRVRQLLNNRKEVTLFLRRK